MTLVGLLTLALIGATPAEADRQRLLEVLVAPEPARLEIIDTRQVLPQGCVALPAPRAPVRQSGVAVVELEGRDTTGRRCRGTLWARVRVVVAALVTTRLVPDGAPLAGSTAREDREIVGGVEPLTELSQGARAAQVLARGTMLEGRHLRGDGPAPGERVAIVVRLGDVQLEQEGVAVACPGRVCARLPNGHRVEGALVGGRVEVSP